MHTPEQHPHVEETINAEELIEGLLDLKDLESIAGGHNAPCSWCHRGGCGVICRFLKK